MKNIHVLQTDKPSRLHYYSNVTFGVSKEHLNWKQGRNIYITSDEKIKDGDYYIDFTSDGLKIEHFKTKDDWVLVGICGSKKIILTTDQDLINDGVQSIDDEFLQWFIKNPSCEEVEVESWQPYADFDFDYKIIIPQEEPKKLLKRIWIKLFLMLTELGLFKKNFNKTRISIVRKKF
jgi:hypothetical protein